MKARLISIESIADDRGTLLVGEFPKSLPFQPARFFYIRDVPVGELRGNHAHKSNQQVLFCLYGKVNVRVYDGIAWAEFSLEPGVTGLYLPALHWAEEQYLEFNTQLLVIASDPYDPEEYIRTLKELRELCRSSF